MTGKFHIGWFHGNGFSATGWNRPWAGSLARDWARPDYWAEMVRVLERARMECFILEDSVFVPEDYGGSRDYYLRKAARVPKGDPVPLMAALGQVTQHIGLLPTMSSSFYPPYLAARLIATMDHMTGGRAGCNLVTSTSDTAAQNFGLDQHYEHHDRYAMAEEFVEVLDALWGSWDEDAIVADRENDVFIDPAKVRQIDFKGKYFSSRGPLNTPRPPQGRPVICQAGNSPQGRAFAARSADIMLGSAGTLEGMTALTADMRQRATAAGRYADDLKVMFVVGVRLADSEAHAKEMQAVADEMSDDAIVDSLAGLSSLVGIDFSKFDLDQPIEELTTNGQQGSFLQFQQRGSGKTLRQLVETSPRLMDIVGTPAQVAERLGEVWEATDAGGFLVSSDNGSLRNHMFQVSELLMPELQRRGLTRSDYSSTKFRDNLTEF